MSFSSQNGYQPVSIDEIMLSFMNNVNTQFGLSYTTDTFVGTNFYKYFYAIAQRLQESEIKMSEIFLKLQEYFVITNEAIDRPNTTPPGIYDYFKEKGFQVSVKPTINADAGKAFICVNTDSGAADYAVTKVKLCGYVRDCVVAGVVSQGTEVTSLTLSNGQAFDFKYNLPDFIPVKLRLTTTLSINNEFAIPVDDDIKKKLFDNVNARYGLGRDFEPMRYFSVLDAPWASVILLEWSDDGGSTWASTVFSAAYDDLYTFTLADISLVEM